MSPRVETIGFGFRGVASIITIVVWCWSDIEPIDTVVAPAAFGIVKYNYFRSRRGHWSFIVVEDTMHLCVG